MSESWMRVNFPTSVYFVALTPRFTWIPMGLISSMSVKLLPHRGWGSSWPILIARPLVLQRILQMLWELWWRYGELDMQSQKMHRQAGVQSQNAVKQFVEINHPIAFSSSFSILSYDSHLNLYLCSFISISICAIFDSLFVLRNLNLICVCCWMFWNWTLPQIEGLRRHILSKLRLSKTVLEIN